ncbi:hypothetical protein [Lacticaseibacillus manihotivorans]|uniref:hypothetical protein n=1 Tax=Lacticaseibacillus manihotivorans TaxID=88233 RepID=UPI001FB32C4D|nr:hypothetical protein [Lacticaseibacillus manihotivorans]
MTGNIASVPKAGETADGKYSVIAKVSAKTELKGLGSTSYLMKDTKAGDNVGTALHIDGSAPKGSAGALYTNIASMGGRSLDLAIVATDWSSQVATIQFRTKSIGVDLIPVGGDGTISQLLIMRLSSNSSTWIMKRINLFRLVVTTPLPTSTGASRLD